MIHTMQKLFVTCYLVVVDLRHCYFCINDTIISIKSNFRRNVRDSIINIKYNRGPRTEP